MTKTILELSFRQTTDDRVTKTQRNDEGAGLVKSREF